MSDIVFILGAGASKESGAPLMADFLDVADSLRSTNRVNDVLDAFETVSKAIGDLQSVYSKSYLDLNNVESVFAAFEMARIISIFKDYKKEEIEALTNDMKIMIIRTLEESIRFKIDTANNAILIHDSYVEFASLLRYLVHSSLLSHSVSIITFNYDICLDFAIGKISQIPYDYCFTEKRPENTFIPLLKLHGSINWAQCSNKACKDIYSIDIKEYLNKHEQHFVFKKRDEKDTTSIPIGSTIKDTQHECGHKFLNWPVIVPPTWNKTNYHNAIPNVWKSAAQQLSTAKHIFVIGYSYPETDYFFHYLYALGTIGNNILKQFTVFDPNINDRLENRYSSLLGSGAKDRFRIFPNTFTESAKIIREYFELNTPMEVTSEELQLERLKKVQEERAKRKKEMKSRAIENIRL